MKSDEGGAMGIVQLRGTPAIEATAFPSKSKGFKQTGQFGNVMI